MIRQIFLSLKEIEIAIVLTNTGFGTANMGWVN